MPSNERHFTGLRSPSAKRRNSGFTSVIVVTRPLAASITTTSPMLRASTDLNASRVSSLLRLIE